MIITKPLHIAVLLLACSCLLPAAIAPAAQPDILMIMPDQMRGDCIAALGHPVLRTPTIDQLARDGVLFRRAYATVPSCIPARFALLTGQYPQTSGVVGFHSRPFSSPTLPKLLADAGYATVLVGRTMHQVTRDTQCGYQRSIAGSTYVPDDDYDTFLKQASPQSGGIRKVITQLGTSYNGWRANAWSLPDDQHPTAWVAAQARQVIAAAVPEKPLFITVSFYAPHSPLCPPKNYFDFYLNANLPPAAHGDWVDWKSIPAAENVKGDVHRVRLDGQLLRRAQAGYFGLIEHIDAQIAPVIDDFKQRAAKAGRDWLILFTADHGEMLGDHGYFRKCEPYEGADNIPFIIAGSPGLQFKPAARVFQPVCLEDALPTLLDAAGVKRPDAIDGVSLLPVLRAQPQSIRPWLHTEHAPCYSKEQAFHALTDGHVKYIWRPFGGAEHLFDLDADPREEHDLSRDPAHQPQLQQWRNTLIARLANRPEGFSDGHRLIPDRPYPPVQKTPTPEPHP